MERTSVSVRTHRPSRDDAGRGGLNGGASRSRGTLHRVRAQSTRGSASRSSARTTKGVRGTRHEEGLRPPKRRREPSLGGVRFTREARLFGGASLAQARQPEPAPQGEGKGRRRGEVRHLFTQNEDPMPFAVGARTSSYLQKSVERPRTQRSASPTPEWSKARPVTRSA